MSSTPSLVPVALPVRSTHPTCSSRPLPAARYNALAQLRLTNISQYIEKDGALARRFQMVMVDSTTPEETIQILENIKEKYEDHHHVIYTQGSH